MNISIMIYVIAFLSLVLAILVSVFLWKIFKGFNNRIIAVETKREEFGVLSKKFLTTEFVDLTKEFELDLIKFGADVSDEMRVVKEDKEKKAIKEALELLNKQNSDWFSTYFSSDQIDDDVIEKVYSSKYEPMEEKYTEFIGEVLNEEC